MQLETSLDGYTLGEFEATVLMNDDPRQAGSRRRQRRCLRGDTSFGPSLELPEVGPSMSPPNAQSHSPCREPLIARKRCMHLMYGLGRWFRGKQTTISFEKKQNVYFSVF
jgi:hypothetical protein